MDRCKVNVNKITGTSIKYLGYRTLNTQYPSFILNHVSWSKGNYLIMNMESLSLGIL